MVGLFPSKASQEWLPMEEKKKKKTGMKFTSCKNETQCSPQPRGDAASNLVELFCVARGGNAPNFVTIDALREEYEEVESCLARGLKKGNRRYRAY
jgi:hypothetical protein